MTQRNKPDSSTAPKRRFNSPRRTHRTALSAPGCRIRTLPRRISSTTSHGCSWSSMNAARCVPSSTDHMASARGHSTTATRKSRLWPASTSHFHHRDSIVPGQVTHRLRNHSTNLRPLEFESKFPDAMLQNANDRLDAKFWQPMQNRVAAAFNPARAGRWFVL